MAFVDVVRGSLQVDKLDRHGAWLLKSVTMFKSPNQASRLALEGGVVGLGLKRIEVRPELKELALELSRIAVSQDNSNLVLDCQLMLYGRIGYTELCSIHHQALVIDVCGICSTRLQC